MVSIIGKKLGYGYSLVIFSLIIAILVGIVLMNNAVKFLKLVAEDKLNAAIATMDVRINRAERNIALKEIILLGEDKASLPLQNHEPPASQRQAVYRTKELALSYELLQ